MYTREENLFWIEFKFKKIKKIRKTKVKYETRLVKHFLKGNNNHII